MATDFCLPSKFAFPTYLCAVWLFLIQVSWAEQQVAKRRKKRDVYTVPTDPKFNDQWYLVSMLTAGLKGKSSVCVSGTEYRTIQGLNQYR